MTTAQRPARRTETGLGATNRAGAGEVTRLELHGRQIEEMPGRRPGSVYVRPMFEALADFAAEGWHDAARWPEPFAYDDLGDA